MSLKGFHIVFIVFSILLVIGFSVWSFQFAQTNERIGYFLTGIVSAFCGMVLIAYGITFGRKVKC